MKVCSVCRNCYEDSVELCPADDHLPLTQTRPEGLEIVAGYRMNSRIESNFPTETYKATHLKSGKPVSIRVIKTEKAFLKLEAELQKASQISNPNLAKIFEFGELSENEFYVIEEYFSKQSLRDYLEDKQKFPELQAINIARHISEGLEAIHKAGLIHRAVAPANIYFKDSGSEIFSVKLRNFDFGGIMQEALSNRANGVDAKTEMLRYFSPEQYSDKNIDFKSDIYSLAVVLYEMLLGSSPYIALDTEAISDFVFNESDVSDLHLDLRALLAHVLKESLQQRLDLRPANTGMLVRQLRHLEQIANRKKARSGDLSADRPKPLGSSESAKSNETPLTEEIGSRSQIPENSVVTNESLREPVFSNGKP